ncbi:MAG: hypothetical protein E7384_07410 [Ruminococcaceae bacterium]|nr:hypothetical protein [Oscillospiraceae bacterium]
MKNPNLDTFPLGFWCTTDVSSATDNDVKDWKELGMSLVMGHGYDYKKDKKEDFIKMLDAAHTEGIKIILCDHRTESRNIYKHSEEKYISDLKDVINDFGSHPAVWGIHIGDEPWDEQEHKAFYRAMELVRELAPGLEPYANLLPHLPGVLEKVGKNSWTEYLDEFITKSKAKFISYDCYVQMIEDPIGVEVYYSTLKDHGDASKRHDIPFWTILLAVPHFHYRNPSLDEFRWQLNTAVACGAKGISWFYIYQQEIWNSNYRNAPVNQIGRKTENYYRICDVQNIFNRTIGPVVNKLDWEKTYHIGKAYGGFELFEGDEEVAKDDSGAEMIMTYFTDSDGTRYILLVNNSMTKDVLYTLQIKGSFTKAEELMHDNIWREMAGLLFDDGQVEKTDDVTKIPHWYAPGQAILYKITR